MMIGLSIFFFILFLVFGICFSDNHYDLFYPKTWFCNHDWDRSGWDAKCKKCGYIVSSSYR